ncbi:MAG: helix-turn-helix transcriptional regulator [Tissierellales bacterium]|nr:helix-turn-helix transcriptional regulator [Tissierellales bacterium]
MQLSIGSTIKKLRENKGISVEEFAHGLDIPKEVVEMWENNLAYPDITLLSSIARLLGTTIDSLLMFETELTPEDVNNIYKICAEKFTTSNYYEAMEMCEKYLKEYPDSLFLKFRIGSLLQEYIQLAHSEEEADRMLNRSIELLEEASNIGDLEVKQASLYVLSSLYTMKGEYEKAIDLLNTLPKINVNTGFMLSTIYSITGDSNKAKKIEQESLFNNINNSIISLASLWGIALKDRDFDYALELANLQRKLIQDFELEGYLLGNNILMFADTFAMLKDEEKTLSYIEKYVDWLLKTDKESLDLSKNKYFYLVENLTPNMSYEYNKQNFIGSVVKNPEYDFIKYTDKYKKIIGRIF